MNDLLLSEIMIWVFGFATFAAWVFYAAEKDQAKKKEAARELNNSSDGEVKPIEDQDKDTGLGTLIISLIGLVFSIVMYLSEKSDYNALLTKFKKGDDIYCYSSTTDSKWEKVNKSDGWYLEEDTLKHKDKGLKFGIHRCKDSF